MHAAMCDFDAAVASFQEVNINTTSAVGYVSEWQAKRCKIILSPPDVSKCHRVALVSTLPVTPAHLQLDLAGPRVAAGLIAWPSGTVHHHILVAAFYGYADSAERTHAAFAELHLALQAYGGHFIIVGDFNVTQEEGPISAALAAGTLRAADDASQVSLPATSPADIRRIDFALHHPCLFALNVTTERRKPLSDHALVAYDYGHDLYPPMWRAPRFRDFSAFEHLEDEHRTILHQAEPALLHLLQNNQVEEAWVALSNLGEDLLGVQGGGCRRSDLWEPSSYSRHPRRPSKQGHESPGLQALRRLTQRLHQQIRQPWRDDLRKATARSIHGVRVQVPELPSVDLNHPDLALESVEALELQYRQQERRVRLEQWQASIRDSVDNAIKWVKRRADKALHLQSATDPVATKVGYVHPAAKIEDQGAHWTKRWASPFQQPNLPAFNAILDGLSSRETHVIDITPTVEDLQKAMRKMRKTAPGPDGWAASTLLKLPPRWWQLYAMLWKVISATGQIPRHWQRSTIVLIAKNASETRPIALLSTCWRAGARAIVQRLRPWTLSWMSHRAVGGAPSKSAVDLHKRVFDAWVDGTTSFVQQDLHAFFDSLSTEVVCRALCKLGAPGQLVTLVQSFYSMQLRMFTAEGLCDSQWRTANIGILQGCPLSPLLSLGLGQLWTEHIAARDIECGIFVDDRCMWSPRNRANSQQVENALARSDAFDAAAGLSCRPRKCHLVTCEPDGPWHEVTRARGYTQTATLDFLGVSLALDTGETSLLKMRLPKLLERVRLAALTGFGIEAKARVLKALIFPAMFWAAGVAVPEPYTMTRIAESIRWAFQRNLTQEAPRVLVGQVLGWELDVFWLAEWSAIRALERLMTSVLEPSEAITLNELQSARCHGLPVANQVIQQHGWQLDCHNRALLRRDDQMRTRTYRMGVDSPRVLRSWLIDCHKLQATMTCGRIVRSLHRHDPSLAVGLSLPAPPSGTRFAFSGHKTVYRRPAGPFDRHAALAVACNSWFLAKRLRFEGEVKCLCGRSWPSRAHLQWLCPALDEQRPSVDPPTERVGERLLGAPLREFPPPPPTGITDREELKVQLKTVFEASPQRAVLATDGSSRDEIGAFSIVSESPPWTFVGADEGEDQTPFRMELLALVELLTAAATLPCLPKALFILVDCEAALKALVSPGACCLRLLAYEAFSAVKLIRMRATQVHFIWVPSHGKKSRWTPPFHLDATTCRRLNEQADIAARRHCAFRSTGANRQRWHAEHIAASTHEVTLVSFSSRAGTLLEDHMKCTARAAAAAAE